MLSYYKCICTHDSVFMFVYPTPPPKKNNQEGINYFVYLSSTKNVQC